MSSLLQIFFYFYFKPIMFVINHFKKGGGVESHSLAGNPAIIFVKE